MKFLACVALAIVGSVAADERQSTKCALACRFEAGRVEAARWRCFLKYGFLQENCEFVKKVWAENAALNKRLGCPPCPRPTWHPSTATPTPASLPEQAAPKVSSLFQNPICAAAYEMEWAYVDAVDINCFLRSGFNGDCPEEHDAAVAKMNKRNEAIHCPPLPPNPNDN